MNIQSIMKQIQKVQAEAQKAQAELETREFEGAAGGGAVRIVVTGAYAVRAVEIAAELAESGDREMIADAVKAALEAVLGQVQTTTREAMSKAMGGMDPSHLPSLF